MVKPYSQDLRQRVVAAVVNGESCRAVARLFSLSPSAVIKWTQRFNTTGEITPKAMGGVRRNALGDQRDWLRQRLAGKPDLTLEALRSELLARGRQVSVWTVWNFCRSEGLTFKKSLLPSEQLRQRIARWRQSWQRLQPKLDATRLVFIDG
jgi:transposase